VAGIGFIADYFPSTSLPEPLGGTFVRLYFGHGFLSMVLFDLFVEGNCLDSYLLAFLFPNGSQNHNQSAPFLLGRRLDHRNFFDVGDDSVEKFEAIFPVYNFPAFKKDNDLGLVARFNEPGDMLQLKGIIMLIGVGTKLDLFEVNDFLILFSFVCFFALTVFEFAKIHDPANGRIGRWRHFHKVQIIFLGHVDGILSEKNSHLFSVIADHGNFLYSYHFVGPLLLSFN
jgi:hypothetical protein